MFPLAYIKQKCKKNKTSKHTWYNTYKYTAYIKKKKKSENSESVPYSAVSSCLQPRDCSRPGYPVHGIL